MNPEDTIYLYSVYPKKVIKGLPCNAIRTPKSLYLTKEQVLICLKSGSVYRRFANQGINEKVNINNIDRLHNETYMDEKEYKEYLESLEGKERGEAVVNETPEVNEPADKKPIIEDPIVNETPVVEEQPVEEAADEEPNINDNINVINEEGTEVEETPVVEEEEKATKEPEENTEDMNQNKNQYNKNNYNGKNKHRR